MTALSDDQPSDGFNPVGGEPILTSEKQGTS
jgi:hypothetical protein